MTGTPLKVLVLGASYGLLPGIKLAMVGHQVTFVGRVDEISQMAQGDLVLRIPWRRTDRICELRTRDVGFAVPREARPESANLVILAMQEPQFADPDLQALLQRVSNCGTPCLSIMNLPPPPFLRRLGLNEQAFAGVYSSGPVWDGFDPQRISNASPDPQALRMDPARPGELTVTLASNFKAAPFADPASQAILARLARDMSRLAIIIDGNRLTSPVSMLAHSSPFIPLAKWPMLITGNCRCVTKAAMQTIAEAVLYNPNESASIYTAVSDLVLALGAPREVLVPFAVYARATESLVRPSSAARALAGGATHIERIDLLVFQLMQQLGLDISKIEPIVELIERRLAHNR